jgi:hypothetical protein
MIKLEHSPLGGSGAHRFLACAGSFLLHRAQLENDEFENITSEYADLGTAAHELAATCLTEEREPFEFLGKKFGRYTAGTEINLDAIGVYVNECERIWQRDGKGKVLIEETIKLPDLHPLLRGTVDFGYWSVKRGVYLRDYKNGEGIGVGAVNNKQLLYYGFLMVMGEPWLRDGPKDLPVNLGIVQPNFYGIYEEPETWETTLGYVRDWGHDELLPRMHDLMKTQEVFDTDFVPGEHCQFCPVLLDCPKMQKAFKDYAQADEEFIAMLTDQELDQYYAQREQARRFMNALESTVHARLVGGSTIPSAKLVEKKTARIWRSGAEAALESAFGKGAYEPPKIKSPAAVEKLSSRGKEMALEWGYKPEAAGLSVAPISDPRPEAKPKGNASVFADHAQSAEDAGR